MDFKKRKLHLRKEDSKSNGVFMLLFSKIIVGENGVCF
ncbi:hypothetical protein STRDD11_01259 [Streptococcus sp. DD11]|nr:hypothetical protein STRDD11_01259 [Streptococcus sp. DD11]